MKTDATRNERQRRWYNRNKELKNTLTRKRYADFKAAGLCPTCGGEPEPGFVLCHRCRAIRNA